MVIDQNFHSDDLKFEKLNRTHNTIKEFNHL
jgi:hypothetical protein